jgi:hypothetical protein
VPLLNETSKETTPVEDGRVGEQSISVEDTKVAETVSEPPKRQRISLESTKLYPETRTTVSPEEGPDVG